MDGVKTRVRRKDILFKKLRKSVRDIDKEAGDAALLSGTEMVTQARRYVSRDKGDLEESTVVTPAGQRPPAYSQPGGVSVVPAGAAMVTAGNSKVRYAHLVEYGTSPHEQGGMFKGTQHPGTEAQPFFWPAYRMMRRRIKSRFSRALSKAIKKAKQ